MKIGVLAQAAATAVETIRYYEREGLLPEVPRTESNYRVYGEDQVERLAFIRHCRSLDMTLDEIRVLLHFKDAPAEECGAVNAMLAEHLEHVDTRIRELRALQKQLRELREACLHSTRAADCGILNGLVRDAVSTGIATPPPSRQLGHVHGTHHAHAGNKTAK